MKFPEDTSYGHLGGGGEAAGTGAGAAPRTAGTFRRLPPGPAEASGITRRSQYTTFRFAPTPSPRQDCVVDAHLAQSHGASWPGLAYLTQSHGASWPGPAVGQGHVLGAHRRRARERHPEGEVDPTVQLRRYARGLQRRAVPPHKVLLRA
eukprot:606955-Prorocentrum_minimum.AAC.1